MENTTNQQIQPVIGTDVMLQQEQVLQQNQNVQMQQPQYVRKKVRPFFDHPVCAMITLMFCGLTAYSIVGSLAQLILGDVFMGYAAAVVAIGIWIAYRIWFQGEFKGSIRMPSFKRKDVVVGLFIFTVMIISCDLIGFIGNEIEFTIGNLGLAMMAGFGEEICIRVLPVSIMMRDWMDEKHVPTTVFSTSILFGLVHFSNVINGAPLYITLIQVILAFGIGTFFAAVYIRSGNILLCILLHMIHDTLAFMIVGGTENGIMQTISTFDAVSSLVIGLVSAIIGTVLIRKSVRGDIVEVWRERWSYELR